MKNVLIITTWNYDEALIQTYTLPYVKLIGKALNNKANLYFVTFEKIKKTPEEKSKLKAELIKNNIHLLMFNYQKFGIWAFLYYTFSMFYLLFFIFRKNISNIHCWCTPAGSLGYFLSVLTRRPLVVDSFEPHSESMVENGAWQRTSFAFKILFWFEKLQVKKASHIIGLTVKTPEYIKEKYNVVPKKYFVKPSCLDLSEYKILDSDAIELFKKKLNITQKYICVYAGKFGGIYLSHEVFGLVNVLQKEFNNDLHFLIISSNSNSEINVLANNENLNPGTFSHYFALPFEVKNYLAIADFALNPVKPVPSKRYCTSIKDGEYWASGLPVIITKNISDDSDIIEENNAGAVLKNLTVEDYTEAAKKIKWLFETEKKEAIQIRIKKIAAEKRNINNVYSIYESIYK